MEEQKQSAGAGRVGRGEPIAQVDEFEKLMDEMASGSQEAVWRLAEKYAPQIVRVVRRSLPSHYQSKLDPQDVAQSLWAALLLRPAELAQLKSAERLIAYLAQAARKKVIDKVRYFNTQKCDIGREQALDQDSENPTQLYSRDPTPSKNASLRERLDRTFLMASERDKKILSLRIQGCDYAAIGRELRIDEKTARRVVDVLGRQILQ